MEQAIQEGIGGVMKLVCAWCGKTIREGRDDGIVSHGICKDCAREMCKEIAREREKVKREEK